MANGTGSWTHQYLIKWIDTESILKYNLTKQRLISAFNYFNFYLKPKKNILRRTGYCKAEILVLVDA